MKIFKNNELILAGKRNTTDGLWDIQLSTRPQQLSANAIIRRDKTKYELAQYLYACAYSPALSTFQIAIRKGHLLAWPGIHNLNFERMLKNTITTAKGHMAQERKNLQSTKTESATNNNKIEPIVDNEDFHPTDGNEKTYEYVSMVIPFNPKGTTYTD